MQTPTKSKLVKFNIKNLKYALRKTDDSGWDNPKPLAGAVALALEPDFNEQIVYADGEKILSIPDDKGFTGELTVRVIEDHYEIDMGRAMKIQEGHADIQQLKSTPHCIYYEVDGYDEGVKKTYKTWLINCRTGRASESYQQTEDDPTFNAYAYPLTVLGEKLMDSTGTEEYTDENGNTIKITRVTSKPTDAGYDTFGSSVPTLQAPAE